MPVLYKIATETNKILTSFKEKIDRVYITGMGATINNIDLSGMSKQLENLFNERE